MLCTTFDLLTYRLVYTAGSCSFDCLGRLFCLGRPDICSRLRDKHTVFKLSIHSNPSHTELYTGVNCINSVQGYCAVSSPYSLQATHLNQDILIKKHNSNLIFINKKEKSVFNLWSLSQLDAFRFKASAEGPTFPNTCSVGSPTFYIDLTLCLCNYLTCLIFQINYLHTLFLLEHTLLQYYVHTPFLPSSKL